MSFARNCLPIRFTRIGVGRAPKIEAAQNLAQVLVQSERESPRPIPALMKCFQDRDILFQNNQT